MPDNFDQLLSDLSKQSNLLNIIQLGRSPEEIKTQMLLVLDPYFSNKKNLIDLIIPCLVGDFHEFLKISETSYFVYFQDCLTTFNRAKLLDPDHCFEGIANFELQMNNAVGIYWSVYFSHRDFFDLSDEDFLYNALLKIGELCEAILKPFLKFLLYQVKITVGETSNFEQINNMSLGDTIDELIKDSGYPEFFRPEPKKIKLNDWRNIAYHHSANIRDSLITCKYGRNNCKSITLSKGEMISTINNILFTLQSIKLSCKFFSVDNIYEIAKLEKHWKDEHIRTEVEFLGVALGMMTQGFKINSFNFDKEQTNVSIIDVTEINEDSVLIQRVAHASQFLIYFWLFTKSDMIKIQYNYKDASYLLSVSGVDCKKASDDTLTLSEYVATIRIKDLVTGRVF